MDNAPEKQWHFIKVRWGSLSKVMPFAYISLYSAVFYNTIGETHWLPTAISEQKPQHNSYAWTMGLQPLRQETFLQSTPMYLATIYPAKFLITTDIHLNSLQVSTLHGRDLIDPTSLGAHTQLPLHCACPEGTWLTLRPSQHTPTCHYTVPVQKGPDWPYAPRSTHKPATTLCLSRSRQTHTNAPVYCKSSRSPDFETAHIQITHSTITSHKKSLKLVNFKLFEISTSSWLKPHNVLVKLLQYIQPDDGHRDAETYSCW